MFVRKKEFERLAQEAAVSAERERLVQVLVEQIEYLRMQIGLATSTVSTAASIASTNPTLFNTAPLVIDQPWVGEEEDDLRAMLQAGVISHEEFTTALERVSQREHIIE